MDITELKIGTKLELEIFNDDGIRLDYTMVSEFEWLTGENTAIIAAPIHEGAIFPVHMGTVINIYFNNKKDNDINLFRFKASVSGRETNENLALLKIDIESGIEKVQRRKYYRLDCSVPVRYRVVNSFSDNRNEKIEFKKTITGNLSGGGICLLLEEKIEIGKLVECEINIDPNRMIRTFGKVVRFDNSKIEGKFKYEVGIAFVKINDNDREAVVRYIFDEQRKLRKKGLI